MHGPLQISRCPRDGSHLTLMEDHGMRIRSCRTCHGLWVPMGQIAPRLPAATAQELFHTLAGEATGLLCPIDSHAMRELDIRGVRIDRCEHCRGLWFDAGELTLVSAAVGLILTRPKEQQEPGVFAEAVKETVVEVAIHGGDMVVSEASDSVLHGVGEAVSAIVEFLGSAISP